MSAGEGEQLLSVVLGEATISALRLFVDERVEERLAARERPRWMTVKAAAEYLGVTEKSVRRRVERGQIAYSRTGRRILIDGLALDRDLRRASGD